MDQSAMEMAKDNRDYNGINSGVIMGLNDLTD